MLRFDSIAGDKQLNRERVENASQFIAAEVFLFLQSIGVGDLISILQPGNSAKWLKRGLYVKDKTDCARVIQASRTVA